MRKSVDVVEQFIQRMPAEQQVIAYTLRELIRKSAKSLQPSIKWGYPCFAGVGNVCSIMPYPDHINLVFFRGAELADPDELLEGTGKGMRHVKIRTAKDIRKRAISDLIQKAVSLDQNSAA
jgi:hypothetical protein